MAEEYKHCLECSVTRTVDRKVSGGYIVVRFFEGPTYKGTFYMPVYMDVEIDEICAYWVHDGKLPIPKHAA